jgi:hypothetical protein
MCAPNREASRWSRCKDQQLSSARKEHTDVADSPALPVPLLTALQTPSFWAPCISMPVGCFPFCKAVDRVLPPRQSGADFSILPMCADRHTCVFTRAAKPKRSFRNSSTIAALSGIARSVHSSILVSPALTFNKATPSKPRRPIRISSRCGKMPTLIFLSSLLRNLNVPG